MIYLPAMTEDEIKYVCSMIPLQESVWYFKQYPKDFSKIMPGFRATSLRNQAQVSSVLFKHRNHPFVSSFIEKHISRWIEEIQREISLIMDKGESKEVAWLQTLPFCFFADNIKIFFKLIDEEQSQEYILLLSHSIQRIKNIEDNGKKLNETLNDNKQQLVRLEDEIKHIRIDLEKSSKKLTERSVEIKALKQTNADLKKQTGIIPIKEQEIGILEKRIQERDETIRQVNTALSATLSEQRQLKIKIKADSKKQNTNKFIAQVVSTKPKCPKDINEFRDYLGYNLENLGIKSGSEYYLLLKDHLCEILFTGKPILISRNTGMPLMKCISNALVASHTVATLAFIPDISVEAVDEFISAQNRILCLDNFIGNFNETILTTLCESHKDKIIFLTITYDKTLRFVPEEFLQYCHYLNVNRIESFCQERALTEDSSSVEESESLISSIAPDVLWSTLLKDILNECGVSECLAAYKSASISSEERLVHLLAFDVLPYCVDVLDRAPFVISERLDKYAGEHGRCPYKGLFRRWFF